MFKGGRIKSKVVQSTIQNKDVLDMFHGVLGTGEGADLNIEIVYPKYRKVVEHCSRLLRLLETLRDSAAIGHFPAEAGHLAGYVGALREQAAATFQAPDLGALHPSEQNSEKLVNYSAVTREEYDAFAAVYRRLKGSNLVNTVVVACKNMIPYKKYLIDLTALKDRFLTKTAGLSFAPLPGLPAMNFKQIYISDQLSPADRRFILMVLHKLFTISHDVYDTMSSPDIDVNEFVQVIVQSLDEVKKHIPRCEKAFKKIADSVSLLKNNFGSYYKDFVASNNPTIIMENFVLDVSRTTKSSPRIAAQFNCIIKHYRKLASQQASNPKLQVLFQQVDKNFQELEKRSQGADRQEDSSDADSGADSDAANTALPASEAAEEPAVCTRRGEKSRKRRERRRRQRAEQRQVAALDSGATAHGAELDSGATAHGAEPAEAGSAGKLNNTDSGEAFTPPPDAVKSDE